jgi:ectoine hydroxylase-related dioxygenase (phytanoyl-CoA dioxygenase family)
MIIKNIVKKIFAEGYYVHNYVLNKKKCDNYIKAIKKIQNKIKKNPNFKDERSDQGQEIIRDLILRDPDVFLNLIDNIVVIQALNEIFKDKFILDNCMASNSVNVKNAYSGLVHIDSHLSCNLNNNTSDVVILFCLEDFTKDNGATKIWPGSHLSGVRIQNSKNYKKLVKKKYKYAEAKKGSIIFFLGQTWHQIGKNISKKSRWGILCHYKRWWIKPSTDYTKCGASIYSKLNQVQKELFGFNSISPKFNLKKQIRTLKTLRDSSKLSQKYKEVIQY